MVENNKTKIIRRIDPKKVQEIQNILTNCRDAGFSEQDTKFYEYKGVPKATLLEHAAAKHPLYIVTNSKTNKKKMDADILKSYREEIRVYNKSMMNPDDEIIGVPYLYQDIEGNECKIFFRQLATHENISKSQSIEKCDQRIAGEKQKKERLLSISKDVELKKRQDSKMRVLQRKLRKGKRDEGSE